MTKPRVKKLTFWVAEDLYSLDGLNGDPVFDIRCRTRRECLEQLKEQGLTKNENGNFCDQNGEEKYAEPRKVVIEYFDAFDLLDTCCGDVGYQSIEVDAYPDNEYNIRNKMKRGEIPYK